MASTLELSLTADVALLKNAPAVTLYQTTGQSVATGANTQISWNTAVGDNWAGWSSGSPTRYTVQVAGWYMLSATIPWPNNSTSARHVEFYYNGVEQLTSLTIWNPAPAAIFPHSANTVIIQANVGDYFQTNVYQTSGVSLTLSTTSSMCIQFVHF